MRDSPAFDDEDLWFPAHMSAGDSFSRPLAADGAAAGTAVADDGIGLPRRRPGTRSGTPRRRGGRGTTKTGGVKASSWLWLTLWGAAALGIATYAARKEIVVELAQGWLKGQGVPAHLRIDTLSLGHASGSFILGPADRPDLRVGHFDADFSLDLLAGGGRPLARVKTARLGQVGLRLSWKDGKPGFGTLDRLVHNLSVATNVPPRAITVDDASVVIDSDYGTLRGHGSAAYRDGRLSYLSLKLPAAHLDGTQGGGDLGDADLLVQAVEGHALQIEARANATELDLRDGSRVVEGAPAHPIQARGVTLDVSGRVPYRETGALSGSLGAVVGVTARTLSAHGLVVSDADYRIKLDGRLRGRGQYDGAADIAAHLGHVGMRGFEARRLAVTANGLQVHTAAGSISVAGAVDASAAEVRGSGAALTRARLRATHFAFKADSAGRHGDVSGRVTAESLDAGDISLTRPVAAVTGTLDSDAESGAWRAGLEGDLSGGGRYAGFDSFTFKASRLSLALDGQGRSPVNIDLRLRAPAEADLAGGLTVDLVSQDGAPILASHAPGAFSLELEGGSVATLDLSNLVLSPRGAVSGDYALDGTFNLAPVRGARVLARGHVSTGNGLNATLAQPLSFSAQSADLGETFTHLSGTLGQAGDTVLHADASGWRIDGAFKSLALQAPNEQLGMKDGQGALNASRGGLKADLESATLSDAAPGTERFYPLALSGSLVQDARALTGRFTATVRRQPVLALSLDNDVTTGRGQVGLKTLDMIFAPGGLQPRDLSPMGASIFARQVSGGLGFDGAFRWDHGRRWSSGVLTVDGLSFSGALGTAELMQGKIDFTSLAPLQSAPDQTLGIRHMDIGLPLSDLSITLQVLGDHVAVNQATAATPGGPVRLEPMTVPFDPQAPIMGAIAFDGLDFGRIVAATDLAASLTFEGRLSGRVPFSILGGHATFAGGRIGSDAPGTIAISRQALNGVAASGVLTGDGQARAAAVPPGLNPFQDMAYQAMEHLHYDRLEAQVGAQPGEALDVLWHVEGRFAPPSPRQSKVSLSDYLDGAWAAKPLALPSGTPVDLYLDVPLETPGAR